VRRAVILAVLATWLEAGCGVVYRAGIKLYYKPAAIAAAQVVRDVPYVAGSKDPLQQLNFFKPAGLPAGALAKAGFPVVVFIHGGNWDSGDKDYRFGGQDIYNNIGRFLAARGIGCANISYRLLPTVDWKAQAADAAQSVAWVHAHAAEFGGDPQRLFLMGHSAGAQLAMRVGLDRATLQTLGVPPSAIRGIIGVAGAGYDLADEKTYSLGADPRWYARRFQLGAADASWQQTASPIQFVGGAAPPVLLLRAGGESRPLIRQSDRMRDAMNGAGARADLVVAPGLSHTRIVPTLSREDRPAGAAVLAFVRQHS
jgi:acetyl esterase/lipase